jgi:3-oxoacyl-[acyl-carrier-protein] synthase III
MRIAAVSAAFPSKLVSNSDILEMVENKSADCFDGSLEKLLQNISFYFKYSGAETRRWLASDENAFDLTERAVSDALDRANIGIEDVDVLIHASVDRRVIEPGMSFLLAKALGFQRVQCFDILEACNSWSRAMQFAQFLLQTEENILIITSEFLSHDVGPKTFRLEKAEDLEWAFPSMTVGESTTATVITRDDANLWDFSFTCIPQYADLCVLPNGKYGEEVTNLNGLDISGKGPEIFVAYGKKMQAVGKSELVNIVKQNRDSMSEFDMVFPHSHNKRLWTDIAKEEQWDVPYYFVYQTYGNLVTSSVPAAIYLASQDGCLKRNDRVAGWIAASGLSFSFFQFTY